MLFRWFFTVFSAMAKVLVFLLDRKNDDPFRRHARRGWPLGSARFLAAVERQTRRPLRRGTPGSKAAWPLWILCGA